MNMEESVIEEEIKLFTPSPLKAIAYSLLFPGLGQIYNGDMGKGSYYIVLGFTMVISFYLVIPVFIYIAFLFYCMRDAYIFAKNKNRKNNGE
jgi:TM2 domain-containing membrane protein YozV